MDPDITQIPETQNHEWAPSNSDGTDSLKNPTAFLVRHEDDAPEKLKLEVVPTQKMWRPSYLKHRVLITFIVTCSATIVMLEVLFQYSQTHDGLVSAIPSHHFWWTYVPTAAFTILAALWSTADYQPKRAAPWVEMSKGPSPASRNVLVDYLSPLQPKALWTSIRNRHNAVSCSIVVSIILKLLVMFSTGLISLSTVEVRHNDVNLTALDGFSDSQVALNGLRNVGDLPYKTLAGISNANLSYPPATTKDYAFQMFTGPASLNSSILTAEVDGFSAGLDCKTAELDIKQFFWAIPYNTPSSIPRK